MTVVVMPADRFGCGSYRLRWPGQALAAQGADVTVIEPSQTGGSIGLFLDTPIIPADCDTLVLQRPVHPLMPKLILSAQQQRHIRVVVDMDDDLECIHPRNPAWAMMHPKGYPRVDAAGRPTTPVSWANARECCRLADVVTVTTAELGRRYGYGHAVVIPQCVPERFLKIPHQDNAGVAWPASLHSHPDDPATMGAAMARLNGQVDFRIVGEPAGTGRAFGLPLDPPGSVVEFDDWPTTVASIGVGIAPLADTRFNAAKSCLKPLEMSAVGVPWIASPRADYVRFGAGWGRFADKPKEWVAQLRQLTGSPALRAELSGTGREIAGDWTTEANTFRWATAWGIDKD